MWIWSRKHPYQCLFFLNQIPLRHALLSVRVDVQLFIHAQARCSDTDAAWIYNDLPNFCVNQSEGKLIPWFKKNAFFCFASFWPTCTHRLLLLFVVDVQCSNIQLQKKTFCALFAFFFFFVVWATCPGNIIAVGGTCFIFWLSHPLYLCNQALTCLSVQIRKIKSASAFNLAPATFDVRIYAFVVSSKVVFPQLFKSTNTCDYEWCHRKAQVKYLLFQESRDVFFLRCWKMFSLCCGEPDVWKAILAQEVCVFSPVVVLYLDVDYG